LYEKLKAIGFGGKTLSIIKSLYHNDNITFLLNGQFTDPLWLTQGVKQGLHKIPFNTLPILTILLVGCNLSPLLLVSLSQSPKLKPQRWLRKPLLSTKSV
jgi:hypothetical protein